MTNCQIPSIASIWRTPHWTEFGRHCPSPVYEQCEPPATAKGSCHMSRDVWLHGLACIQVAVILPLPTAPMSKTPTQLKDLAVGDLILTDIVINIADVADPKSKTGTTAK